MKKRLLFCFVALATTLMFAACDKDEPGSAGEPLADNTLVYDGVTYEMIPFVEIYNDNLTMLNAFSKDTSVNGQPKIMLDHFHIRSNEEYSDWNSTTDLAHPTSEEFYEIAFMGEVLTMIGHGSVNAAGGEIDGVVYENESVFTSGTLKVTGENDGSGKVLVELDCVLKNGKTLKMKIRSEHTGMGE